MKFPLIPGLSVLFLLPQLAVAQPGGEVLTNAADVLSLPSERALSEIPVSVTGVVTAIQPDWQGRFFVQDKSAGVFVENVSEHSPALGDVVRVSGVTHPGGFAPIIAQPRWEKLGTAPLPEAEPVSIEELILGKADSQRVEISGIVRSMEMAEGTVIYDIVSGGHRFRAFAPTSTAADSQRLLGARVRVRGTAATSYQPQLRHLIAVTIYVPLASDLTILKTDPGDPFDEPIIPLNRVAQYQRDYTPGKRIHVKGQVTYQRPGEDLFLWDGTAGLHVKTRQPDKLVRGDLVEVVGFPGYERYLPVLEDAAFRRVETNAPPPVAKAVPLEELQAGVHHAEFITIRGRLLDRTGHPAERGASSPAASQVTLTIQASNFVFTAVSPAGPREDRLAAIPLGSLIELDGICMLHIRMGGTMESGDVGTMESLQLLLPDSNSVRVLRRPSWLTPQRLSIGLATISTVLVLVVSWSLTVSRKNAALKVVVREKAEAQQALQKAHDELDQRVRRRTEQLKTEMDARREAEVRFKATLAERTRLAQELHDTLEQSLTGIGLQLDTAANLVRQEADGASRPLDMARTLMTRSQLELRRSIWDLRSRELEQFDLPNALQVSAREIVEGKQVHLDFNITGKTCALSEVVEENLLRIAREAITNVIKHADATRVTVHLAYDGDQATLVVSDNGRGFDPADCPGSTEGHFGLSGMSERTKRIGGHIRVRSTPGTGTSIEVSVPTRSPDQPAATPHRQ